ncbi:MAG: sugar phosphate isomerase/epimerase [Clostridia bacterium]|nr:sugar phosphate isomerase/epimerase [Clostridia bacterium]
MQFGMPTLIENRTLSENAALLKALGLAFIELNMNFPEYQIDRLEETGVLLRLAEENGFYYTLHLDENLDAADFNPLVSRAWLETVRRSVTVMKKLLPLRARFGDPNQPLVLNMHMHHGVHITLPDRKVQMYERDFDAYMRSYALFRSLCEEWIGESDLVIAVENTDGFRSYEKAAVAHLLESPKFGLTWDVGHSRAAGEIDGPFLAEHRDRLVHFHLHDARERPPRDHLAFGDGEIDLADRLRAAEKRNARCVLETKTADALSRSAAWLVERGFLPRDPAPV